MTEKSSWWRKSRALKLVRVSFSLLLESVLGDGECKSLTEAVSGGYCFCNMKAKSKYADGFKNPLVEDGAGLIGGCSWRCVKMSSTIQRLNMGQ